MEIALTAVSIDSLKTACSILRKSKNTLILTGAGISAESGIPTFRGQGGYWKDKTAEELATLEAFTKNPRLVWDWYLMRRNIVDKCQPNTAHKALAEWTELKKWTSDISLFTQNIDGLHEAAGNADAIRLHGSLWHNKCTKCGKERHDKSLVHKNLPMSPCCNALERPAVIWFGESLDTKILSQAFLASMKCDTILVIGTSGVVMPAAAIISTAKKLGAAIIDINTSEDAVDADIKIRGSACSTLPKILT